MIDRLVTPRRSLPITVVVLVALLSILATLQYRWLGQVAEAERARLQAGARTRVEQFSDAFDREVTRAYAGLRVDADMLGEGGGSRFAARYETWSARTEHPGLVAGVYVAEPAAGEVRLRRFDTAARAFVDAPWPAELEPVKVALSRPERGGPGAERAGPRAPGFAVEDVPALMIPIVEVAARNDVDRLRGVAGGGPSGPWPEYGLRRDDDRPRGGARDSREFGGLGGHGPRVTLGTHGLSSRWFRGVSLVALDRGYIGRELLPALAARHVAGSDELDYAVVVTTRREPRTVIFRSEGADGEGLRSDATASLLEVRFDQVDPGVLRGGEPGTMGAIWWRGPPPGGGRPGPEPYGQLRGTRGRSERGLWEASVTHRGGSLEQVVAHVRWRNLAISFGILLLLGASAAMIVTSSQRARRLAEQQVEFVAGVSHELRTPVAVVCSAGENLADGLVRDPAEVRLYGTTIRDEGRRLAEMVEQVLEFAGITSRERMRTREAVHLASVVEAAVKASQVMLAESGAELAVDVPSDLPAVLGDAAGLRRAVQNLVQNAARHAAAGRWIGISAHRAQSGARTVVRLTVRDRGPGIARADQARLFEPFFRGRQAMTAGISGSGLGLSLVKSIVESHGGTVEMETAPGAGTAFTLILPVAPTSAVATSSAEESNAQADPAR
jgi:signal transduction histidine kinase